jgi:hypothetical protein
MWGPAGEKVGVSILLVKGTLTRDFRPQFFFIKQLPLSP